MRRSGQRVALAGMLALGLPLPVPAQEPPSATEVARYTGLHAAAHQGDLETLRRALVHGAPVDIRDPQGRTPLHLATFARQHEAISLLAAAGAQLDAQERDRWDALSIAAIADDEPTVALLLQLGASAQRVVGRDQTTALAEAAQRGHEAVVRRLLAAGAPVNHVGALGWTALLETIVLGHGGARHQATLKALLAAGADVSLADRQGRTALQLAQARGYAEMVEMLRAAGAAR